MISRREFSYLQTRVDNIDSLGTRGIGVVQQSINDLVAKIVELKAEFENHLRHHELDEENKRKERISNRRFMVSTLIAFGILLVAILALVITGHPSINH